MLRGEGGGMRAQLLFLATATAHVPWWFARPSIDGIALIEHVPATLAIALQLAVLGMLALITQALNPPGPRPQRGPPPRGGWSRVVRGP